MRPYIVLDRRGSIDHHRRTLRSNTPIESGILHRNRALGGGEKPNDRRCKTQIHNNKSQQGGTDDTPYPFRRIPPIHTLGYPNVPHNESHLKK